LSGQEYDYLVVGGGSAGAVLARRLSDDPDVSVCLIEGGPAHEFDDRVLLLEESLALVGNPAYDYDYPITEQERGNSLIRMSRARMLGGCSSHNDSWALRAPDADLDRWAAAGASGWDAAATAPHFDRVFNELRVHRVPDGSDLSRAWVEAAAERGFPLVESTRGDLSEGISWVSLNEDAGVRVSTAVAYLYPLAELPRNLTLRLSTRALRIVVDGGRAIAIETDQGTIRAGREIIVAAGAIDTPRLLMLSGIGPADELQAIGIEPVLDLPGVGANLQDHVETPVTWESARPPGPSINGLDLGLYARTVSDDGFDMQGTIGHFTYWLHAAPFDDLPRPDNAFTFAPGVARPASRGRVRLASADPGAKPLLDPRYFSDPDDHDTRVLVEGIRLARRLAETKALEDWVVQEVSPGPSVTTDKQLAAYAKRYSNTVYHPSGTCRMGATDDDLAVVDPRLRVRGIDGLRIADASIFPELVRVNPNMTVVMVGSRAAELIRQDGEV
jgi:choline oxidase